MSLTSLVYFVSLTCLVHSAINFDEITREGLLDLEEKAMLKCAQKHNINETLFDEAIQEKIPIPTSRDFKCMLGCYNEEMGYSKEKVPQWDIMIKVHKIEYEKQEDIDKAIKLVDICKQKVPAEAEDFCELGYAMFSCYAAESTKLGLQLM
ncbi:hypothetical protein O3M35_000857 [Rhynocoris fuscipes]|uniref:Uncharacterized protein n=1 Tax=Rhynocoris fuscipes TaxID=488301 RepID=A0AAW1DQW4_9HEMI